MDLKEYKKLDSLIKSLQKKRDKATGVLEELKVQLWERFKCKTIEEAKRILNDRIKQQKKLEKEIETRMTKFKQDHPNIFNEE